MIPTHLITGFLGSGKTTALNHLLTHVRPEGERWAILVNEFGEVGIDGATLSGQGDGLAVKELPGGCICCTGGVEFQIALTLLVKEHSPDRLLIEPTGIAKPSQIIDSLRGPGLDETLDIRGTITLVNPAHLGDTRYREHDTYIDQLEVADALVATHADISSEEELEAFFELARGLYPPKPVIAAIAHGELDPAWLDLARAGTHDHDHHHHHHHDHDHDHDHHGHEHDHEHEHHEHGHDHAHAHDEHAHDHEHHAHDHSHHHHHHGHDHHDHDHDHATVSREDSVEDGVMRRSALGEDAATCGWIFTSEQQFSAERIAAWVRGLIDADGGMPGLLRLKGIFNTEEGWALVQGRPGGDLDAKPSSWRSDSRVELLCDPEPAPHWEPIEHALPGARESASP